MIEVFNLNHYIIQAGAFDPDLAVFAQNTRMYTVAGTSPDRIFNQLSEVFIVSGGGIPKIVVPLFSVYSIGGNTPGDVGIANHNSTGYVLTGGSGASGDRIASTTTSAYIITT